MRSYIIFILFTTAVATDKRPLVTTPLGLVRGHYETSYEGKTYAAFEGIPYAEPPVGHFRFEEPQDVKPWLGVWEATTTYECLQINYSNLKSTVGEEDCLYLNIYVPRHNVSEKDNLDVIVGIHGGAFMCCSPTLAGPKYLMDRNIIYVNLNYRLGILGFLSTEDEVVPGNNGLKDQVAALKWIKNNIKYFGGNPNSITIVGLSAGGASVHFHYFSPLSKGLFHRGISHSGTALAPWALQKAPLDKTKKLAESVGCDNSSVRQLVLCLKQRSPKLIVQKTAEFFVYSGFPIAPFAPVIEKRSETAFLSDHPYRLLAIGEVNDVPWISSITQNEGVYPTINIIKNLEEIDKRWDELIHHLLDFNHTVSDLHKKEVGKQIKEFYFKNEKISLDNIELLIELFSHRYFMANFEKAVKMQANATKSPIYAYMYGYKNEEVKKLEAITIKNGGIGHGEDGFLMYSVTFNGQDFYTGNLTESDKIVKEVLLDFIVSFSSNGKPHTEGINWEPIPNSEEFQYLFIRKPDDIKMITEKELIPWKFWQSLPIMEDDLPRTSTKID